MSESSKNWRQIESDPGVLSALVFELGCREVEVEKISSLDPDSLKNLEPIHGLIFIIKMIQDDEEARPVVRDVRLKEIFFAKQFEKNASATYAMLHILLNSAHEDVCLSHTLDVFKEFSQFLDPIKRGIILSNASKIRSLHNSFARGTLAEFDDEDTYHLISFIPIDGRFYELDALKDGPIDLGYIGHTPNWIKVVRPIIEERMQKYRERDIPCSLMGLVTERQSMYEAEAIVLMGRWPRDDEDEGETTDEDRRLNTLINNEFKKKTRYRLEHIRRKHNYLPFIIELLKMLGEQGQLTGIYEKAKQQALEKLNSNTKRKL